ncbi:hypothetical protein BJ165DRAFT_1499830 [Panaeolus papilionaceus]|nr:hypothetical protein BJ165DRAFT_1499830 [Panaeolus papilionaceus]
MQNLQQDIHLPHHPHRIERCTENRFYNGKIYCRVYWWNQKTLDATWEALDDITKLRFESERPALTFPLHLLQKIVDENECCGYKLYRVRWIDQCRCTDTWEHELGLRGTTALQEWNYFVHSARADTYNAAAAPAFESMSNVGSDSDCSADECVDSDGNCSGRSPN